MKNNLNKFPVLLAHLIPLAFMVSCHSEGKEQEAKEKKEKTEQVAPVTEVVPVEKGKLSSTVKIPGELIPFRDVEIYAKENSFVKKIYVDVGSEVKEGQLLVSMDAPEITSRLLEAESRLKGQEAIFTAAKANYDRLIETSKTPGTISPNDLDQAVARKNAEQSQLQALKSAYNVIADTRSYLEIRAPFTGVISSRNVSLGAYVGPAGKGSALPLFILQEQAKLRLVVSVPEAYTGLMQEQGEVSFTVKSQPNEKFKAKISRMAGSLDTRLRSERIEMDVINKDKKLLPGAYAEVNLPLPSSDSSFIVPRTAVVTSTEKVFVIRVSDNKAEWVDVKKGRESEGRIEVYSDDLRPGDNLVKVATDEIRNGSDIKRTTSSPAVTAAEK